MRLTYTSTCVVSRLPGGEACTWTYTGPDADKQAAKHMTETHHPVMTEGRPATQEQEPP